jgi:hypothetical protein
MKSIGMVATVVLLSSVGLANAQYSPSGNVHNDPQMKEMLQQGRELQGDQSPGATQQPATTGQGVQQPLQSTEDNRNNSPRNISPQSPGPAR